MCERARAYAESRAGPRARYGSAVPRRKRPLSRPADRFPGIDQRAHVRRDERPHRNAVNPPPEVIPERRLSGFRGDLGQLILHPMSIEFAGPLSAERRTVMRDYSMLEVFRQMAYVTGAHELGELDQNKKTGPPGVGRFHMEDRKVVPGGAHHLFSASRHRHLAHFSASRTPPARRQRHHRPRTFRRITVRGLIGMDTQAEAVRHVAELGFSAGARRTGRARRVLGRRARTACYRRTVRAGQSVYLIPPSRAPFLGTRECSPGSAPK